MANKIDKKIIGYSVQDAEAQAAEAAAIEVEAAKAAEPIKKESNVIRMHESVKRPDMLVGSTYKVKTPMSEHAMYITINDIILNEGTEHEARRPFEVFINSKNMDNFQWVVALTRLISAVFRKGGDTTFMVEELKAVFDPKGGYFKPGGVFMPSLVAEIGFAIEIHMQMIGMIPTESLDEHQKAFIEKKRKELETGGQTEIAADGEANEIGAYPENSTVCTKCNTKAVVLMDGCMTCLSCGDSKCG